MAFTLPVWTYKSAAEELGTDRFTVAGLIKAHKIKPIAIGVGNAKGIDANGMNILRVALGLKPEPITPVASTA